MTTRLSKELRAANLKMGLFLGSVALAFFIAVIIHHLNF